MASDAPFEADDAPAAASQESRDVRRLGRQVSTKVHTWYWLLCVAPFVLALVVPYRRADSELTHGFFGRSSLNPNSPTTSEAYELRHWAITAGWLLLAVGAVGVVGGAWFFAQARADDNAAAKVWFQVTLRLVPVVLLLGLVLTACTPTFIYEPVGDSGVIWGP